MGLDKRIVYKYAIDLTSIIKKGFIKVVNMKKLLTLGLSLLMALSLAACGGDSTSGDGKPVSGGTYITVESGEASSMNPDTVSDDYLYAIAQNLYSRLVKLNNNYEVLPDLAGLPEVSDDALTYTFKMTDKATWHDGEKVTAEDVVYTYNTIIEKKYANASVFMNVKSIEATDDYTVVFKMSAPDASFLANLAWYGTFIMPEHLFNTEDDDWMSNPYSTGEKDPVGCGPFKFKAWNKGTDVRLVKNEDFFGGAPYLDELVYTIIPDNNTAYQAWKNGEVDEISSATVPTSDLQTLIDSNEYLLVQQEWPSPYYVTFNMKEGPFSNKLVRQAAAYGIDRDVVSQKAFNGFKPAQEYYISNIYKDAHNEDAKEPDCDKDKAMKLLEDAGYKKNADGIYFSTELTIFEGFEDMAEVIIAELKTIGIECKLNVIEYTVWEEKVWTNQEYDFTAVAGFQGPDVLGSLRRWTKDGTVNVNGWSHPEIEKIVTKVLACGDQDQINQYMKDIQVYLADEVTILPMVSYVDHSLFNKNIHGHPMFSNDQGGSRDKAGFSEMTYTWLS